MPLSENDQTPSTKGALPVSSMVAPGDAHRAAATNAPLRSDDERAEKAASSQIGVIVRWRSGGAPARSYHAMPHPSALVVPGA